MFLACALPSSNPIFPSSMSSSSPRSTRLHSRRSSCSTRRRILVVFHSAHPIAALRFQLAWTCLPRSPLLPSKSWAVSVARDSPCRLSSICDLIDCINLHGRVHDGRCQAGWHPHEQIKYVHVPFPMNTLFPAWMMCDADTRGLLTSATCHVLLRAKRSGVLTDMTCCP